MHIIWDFSVFKSTGFTRAMLWVQYLFKGVAASGALGINELN